MSWPFGAAGCELPHTRARSMAVIRSTLTEKQGRTSCSFQEATGPPPLSLVPWTNRWNLAASSMGSLTGGPSQKVRSSSRTLMGMKTGLSFFHGPGESPGALCQVQALQYSPAFEPVGPCRNLAVRLQGQKDAPPGQCQGQGPSRLTENAHPQTFVQRGEEVAHVLCDETLRDLWTGTGLACLAPLRVVQPEDERLGQQVAPRGFIGGVLPRTQVRRAGTPPSLTARAWRSWRRGVSSGSARVIHERGVSRPDRFGVG